MVSSFPWLPMVPHSFLGLQHLWPPQWLFGFHLSVSWHGMVEGTVRRSSAIHFRGRSIRQVSCYTLLSGFRLPWPPSCCLYRPTPFRGSHGRRVRHLSRTFGSSHSASSAYQKWPTWHSHSIFVSTPPSKRRRKGNESGYGSVIRESRPVPPVPSSRVGRGRERPRGLQSFALPDGIATIERQLSWGKLRREPATRRLDWSFAPTPGSDDRFARQRRFGLPPEFPLASSRPGVDRHLSGPWPLATPESAESYSEKKPTRGWCARARVMARGISPTGGRRRLTPPPPPPKLSSLSSWRKKRFRSPTPETPTLTTGFGLAGTPPRRNRAQLGSERKELPPPPATSPRHLSRPGALQRALSLSLRLRG